MMFERRNLAWITAGLLATIAGCGGTEESTTETPPSGTSEQPSEHGDDQHPGPGVGTLEDGQSILFGRRPAPTRPAYDPDHIVREPTSPDPEAGEFTLDEALQGLPTDGQLVVELGTDFGNVFCDLDVEHAPRAVATFVGLARGLRPWWDARTSEWSRRPYYLGLPFHRVIPGYLVQGGDYLQDGTGTVGFTLPYEANEAIHHDEAGVLALATMDGPNSGAAQFYITDGAAPQLDGTATAFGRCLPVDVVSRIARVPQSGAPDNRPLTPFVLNRVVVRRVVGGAAGAVPPAPVPRTGPIVIRPDQIPALRQRLQEARPSPAGPDSLGGADPHGH